jgi:hypothetical protein
MHPADRRDVLVSNLLGPPITAFALPACLLEWALGGGATLTLTARPITAT